MQQQPADNKPKTAKLIKGVGKGDTSYSNKKNLPQVHNKTN